MRMPSRLALVALLATAAAEAQDRKDEPALTSGQRQFQTIRTEMTEAQRQLNKLYRAAPTSEEKQQIQKQLSGLIDRFSDRLFQIAKDHPTDLGAEDALVLLSMQLGVNEKSADE